MLSYAKISSYKIKKILECFAQDYSSVEASKLTNLSRNTTDRYYNIFRKIIRQLFVDLLQVLPLSCKYIGYMESEYGPKYFLNIYKYNHKVFLATLLSQKPDHEKYAIRDKDFYKFAKSIYARFSKFHGFTKQTYYQQVFECIVRYNYSNEEISNYIWRQLKKSSKKS